MPVWTEADSARVSASLCAGKYWKEINTNINRVFWVVGSENFYFFFILFYILKVLQIS